MARVFTLIASTMVVALLPSCLLLAQEQAPPERPRESGPERGL